MSGEKERNVSDALVEKMATWMGWREKEEEEEEEEKEERKKEIEKRV